MAIFPLTVEWQSWLDDIVDAFSWILPIGYLGLCVYLREGKNTQLPNRSRFVKTNILFATYVSVIVVSLMPAGAYLLSHMHWVGQSSFDHDSANPTIALILGIVGPVLMVSVWSRVLYKYFEKLMRSRVLYYYAAAFVALCIRVAVLFAPEVLFR